MEVTQENFDDLLPSILEAIERCTFVAIDAELTGLHLTDEKDNYFDSVEDRYRILRGSCSSFLLVQFGMVVFFYDPDTDTFTHSAFNFYVFPRQVANSSPNVRFSCEASSLEFLASWGFDFNKLFYKGIPYLTLAAEQKMKDNYDKKQVYLAEENSTPCPVPENLKQFMEETQAQIRNLVDGTSKELLLQNLTPFQRKLVFNNIKPKYTSTLYFETIVNREGDSASADPSLSESDNEAAPAKPSTPSGFTRPSRTLRVVKMSEEERKARDDQKKSEMFANIDKGVGFSKVIRKISETQKIVVGHNMILDVGHSVHQFVSDLPEDLASFKGLVQAAFPNLVDTKLMCCTHPFREHFTSSVLGDVLKRVQEEPFGLPKIVKKDNSSYTLEVSKQHEAGYDAFITGVCFIGLCQYLGKLQVPVKKRVLPDSPLVMPFLNKLYLMRMLDISYLNISGTDLTPSRDHVFHVSCTKDATTKSVVNLFSSFGPVQVWWQDDNNLFVSLNDKDQAGFVMKNIDKDKAANYRIVPFSQYQSSREKVKRPLNATGGGLGANKNRSSVARLHNSASSSSTGSNSSGGNSPTIGGGSRTRVHQKKKRPKTDEGNGATGGGRRKSKNKTKFDEPANWD